MVGTAEGLPGSCDKHSAPYLLSPDLVRYSEFESDRPRASSVDTAEYDDVCGMTRRKKEEMKVMLNVPAARRRRKSEVLSGNAKEEIVEKKNALRPNADKGNAVAVPR